MQDYILYVIDSLNKVVWGIPILILLIGTGVLLTVITGFFQFTYFGYMMKRTIGSLFGDRAVLKCDDTRSISQFQALCTALSATIGTGNIAGVAYTITMGGPGAVFWMWVAAVFGMMTNYSENVLGIFYRRRNSKGEWSGGAMYYLHDGLGAMEGCRILGSVLAVLFSVFAIFVSFGLGNIGQVAAIRESFMGVIHIEGDIARYGLAIGILVSFFVFLVIVGGLTRIAKTSERIVPFMAAFYLAGAFIIILKHADMIIPAFASIFSNAFSLKAVAGGTGGMMIKHAITEGVKRGVFSNEAGLGSSVMVHSASSVKEPVTQGLWGIFEVFFDTVIVCTFTALLVLTSGIVDLETGASLSGATKLGLVTEIFAGNFGMLGGMAIFIAVALFAFTTVLGWSYYGSKGWEYLFGAESVILYKFIFLAVIITGSMQQAELLINISDTFNGLMIIPNLIGVLALSGTVMNITNNYIKRNINNRTDIKPMLSFFEDNKE